MTKTIRAHLSDSKHRGVKKLIKEGSGREGLVMQNCSLGAYPHVRACCRKQGVKMNSNEKIEWCIEECTREGICDTYSPHWGCNTVIESDNNKLCLDCERGDDEHSVMTAIQKMAPALALWKVEA